MQTLKNILDNEIDRLISIQQFQEPASAVSSGYKFLDRALNGFRPQHLYLLSSAAESGKTAFLLNLLLNITVKKRNPVKALFYSLDISAPEVAQRLLSCNSAITMNHVFYGTTQSEIIEKLYIDVDQIKDLSNNLLIDDYPICSIDSIRAQLTELKAQNQMPAFVAIDNIDRIVLPDEETDTTAYFSLMENLKKLAIDFNIPLLVSSALCPIDPDIESDRMPRLSMLRKNNINLHVVDAVMFLLMPNYFGINTDNEDNPDNYSRSGHPLPKGFSEMHVRIPLNRCGPIATVFLNANMETQQVMEDAFFNS